MERLNLNCVICVQYEAMIFKKTELYSVYHSILNFSQISHIYLVTIYVVILYFNLCQLCVHF